MMWISFIKRAMSHILLYRACNGFWKITCSGYQKIPIRIGIFRACILAGSPEKATKMAEKRQAVRNGAARAAACWNFARSLDLLSGQSPCTSARTRAHGARARRSRQQFAWKLVSGTYLKIPIRIGNPYSNSAKLIEALARGTYYAA